MSGVLHISGEPRPALDVHVLEPHGTHRDSQWQRANSKGHGESCGGLQVILHQIVSSEISISVPMEFHIPQMGCSHSLFTPSNGEASDSTVPGAIAVGVKPAALLFSLNFHGGLPDLGEADRIKPSHIEQTSLEKAMMHKTLMLPFVALDPVGCSIGGGGLSAEQRATAQVRADQLCQVKQRDPDAY